MKTHDLFFIVVAVNLGGCESKDPHGRQPVTGTVRFQGQPLDMGVIDFLPTASGPTSGARAMIREGTFEVPREQGLAPGRYRVAITSPEPNTTDPPAGPPGMKMPPPGKERIPAKYNTDSQETIEVRASGENRFEFVIE